MSHREISLEELISYLQGTASEPLKNEIDSQRNSDEEFEEELQGWEEYIEDHSDREEAIQHIMAIHQIWKSTPHFLILFLVSLKEKNTCFTCNITVFF